MLTSIIASTVIMFVLAGGFAVVSLVRAKAFGGKAPHSCTDGCSSCLNHCENYDPEQLKKEIEEAMDNK